jgi:uncharacterized protein YidB (DUF937 family)
MGLLDDVLGKAVPGGSAAKPLMLALGALLASGVLFKRSESGAPAEGPAAAGLGAGGGLLGGLGGLLARFEQNGQGDVAKSWVGTGQNQSISPAQLSQALGPDVVHTLAEKTGLSEEDLASHLSRILPGVVDKLTPNGRVPTAVELTGMR